MILAGILCSDRSYLPIAEYASKELQLPIVDRAEIGGLYVAYNQNGPELAYYKDHKPLILNFDFLSGSTDYRRQTSTTQSELARAVGLKTDSNMTIIDATAGMGRDSFILASLGASILLLERSPVIGFLLNYYIDKLSQHPDTKDIYDHMRLVVTDSVGWLQTLNHPVDVIYLDPMFPKKQKSALAKKDMQILQALLGAGDEEEASKLLDISLQKASKRVVVKRPINASPIGEGAPSHQLKGKACRFDVYMR